MTRQPCAERWRACGASSACRTRWRRASSGKRRRASVLRRWRARPGSNTTSTHPWDLRTSGRGSRTSTTSGASRKPCAASASPGTPPRATKSADSRRARMKAVRLLEYGGQLVFNDVPTPTIARDEILVKIKSTAVNHLDLVEASGAVRQILPIDLPWIPGHEFSGVVEQIGSDVAACAPGEAVFGVSEMGAYAEYLAIKTATIARK